MEDNNLKQNPLGQDLKTIHTYSSDMADAVRTNEVSVIKIALAEQNKRELEAKYKAQQGTNVSKILMLLGGIILIGLAIGGVYFLMKKKEAANIAPASLSTKNIDTLISYDDQSFLDTTNATSIEDITKIINTEATKTITPGKIKSLFLTKGITGAAELITSRNFLSIIKTTAPEALTRSLEDKSMTGLYQPKANGSKPHLFMLFQTKDYNQAYAGMLGWEKTMLSDMFLLFGVDISGDRNALLEKPWNDIIIKNKDARILYDDIGTELLYYVFINKNTFLIADNQEAINEIIDRVLAKNIKPL